jgi:hypothetical protein
VVLLAALCWSGQAMAETILARRVFTEFAYDPSMAELTAAERYGAQYITKGKEAGRPVRFSVARGQSVTLISLESVAVCERAKGCPLLVFNDLSKPPILEDFAFQNLILDYRESGTFLIIRVWDKTRECQMTRVGKAKCQDISAKK